MSVFQTNIKGKVNETNVPIEKGYIAILEAISNSIFAIEEKCINNGKIVIEFLRDDMYQDNFTKTNSDILKNLPINSIKITDNGIGLNEKNFDSFMTCNSDYKLDKGGKGIGRFTWLKVFNHVEISSVYQNSRGNFECKSFNFVNDNELKNEKTCFSEDTQTGTTLILKNINLAYKDNFPNHINFLSKIIIEHFLINYITKNMPQIVIRDKYEGQINLDDEFKTYADLHVDKENIRIFNSTFTIYHIKATLLNNSNKCIMCANLRSVENYDLRKDIPNLQSEIGNINGKKVWYCSYLCSDYLNEIVNSERTEFRFPKKDVSTEAYDNITKETLIQQVVNQINKYLDKDLAVIEQKKMAYIDNFIDTKKPQYKNLRLYRSDIYKRIKNNLSDDKLEQALFSEKQLWEKEIKEEAKKIYSKVNTLDITKFNELKNNYIKNITALGKDCLAEYTCHRKSILDMFNLALQCDKNGKYRLEDVVHTLICPMRTVSDDLEYDDMNLWIIDERLSYHYYLASDKTMKAQKTIQVDSNEEMDLAIYDNPIVFNDTPETQPYSSLTIIEFKRPMRNDYTDKENPIKQVLEYVEKIRKGQAKTRNGRPISGNLENLPINVFIISDITDKLKQQCLLNDFTATADGESYYTWHKGLKCYIEIKSFNKVYSDASKRNQILFDKLFEPNKKD